MAAAGGSAATRGAAVRGGTAKADAAFAACCLEIQAKYVDLPRALRIRVERWVAKLGETGDAHAAWMRNRNNYA